jgi:hypothetical protein
MNQARLIKRQELAEREEQQIKQDLAKLEPIVRTTVETVKEWAKKRNAAQPRTPRERFAELFS